MATTLPVLGLSFSFQGPFDTTAIPAAFAYPKQIVEDNDALVASITADVWESVTDFEAGEQPVGTHLTPVPQPLYLQQAASVVTSAMVGMTMQTLNAQLWLQLMQQTLDVQSGVNPDGTPHMVAFYAGSTIVSANKTIG